MTSRLAPVGPRIGGGSTNWRAASGGVTIRESTFTGELPTTRALRRRYAHLGAMMLTLQGDAHMALRPRGCQEQEVAHAGDACLRQLAAGQA